MEAVQHGELPVEIWTTAFSHCEADDIANAAAVCRFWRHITKTDSLWRRLYAKIWGCVQDTCSEEGVVPGNHQTWYSAYQARHLVRSAVLKNLEQMVWPMRRAQAFEDFFKMSERSDWDQAEAQLRDLTASEDPEKLGLSYFADEALTATLHETTTRTMRSLLEAQYEWRNMERGALIISQMMNPVGQVNMCSRVPLVLDNMGKEVMRRMREQEGAAHQTRGLHASLRVLNEFLFGAEEGASDRGDILEVGYEMPRRGGLGLEGNVDEYYCQLNSCIGAVLRRRKGIPITLSVVYYAVGWRCGIPIEMVGMPGHFLAKARLSSFRIARHGLDRLCRLPPCPRPTTVAPFSCQSTCPAPCLLSCPAWT
ncbi:hypothetical protein CYMTET_52426 [Cymbomonas tetramitiformis]|uniref:F-box domain-containing protein n=1 Tax=Cymbomonas tetramitiformis TaxID=36881 RepID=A0AAE0ESR9_9CHLO|nr:hypothetical protein CYMTET_52426 [Cymbomonas tetramitiformis]